MQQKTVSNRKSFEEYIKERYTEVSGKEFNGTRSELLNAYTDIVYDLYKNSSELSKYQRDSFTREDAEQEMVADFVGDKFFANDNIEDTAAALEEIAKTDRSFLQRFRDFLKGIIAKISGERQNKTLAEDLNYLYERLLNVYESETVINPKFEEKYDIVVLENGNTYVKASRKIISGDNVSEWRKQITDFYKRLLVNGKSLEVNTIDGDVLTITKSETAYKARDNYKQQGKNSVKTTDEEFKVKLNAEAHIDELAETSKAYSKNNSPDTKQHNFAKDGFYYPVTYFQDFDGEYYKVTLSVGVSDNISTIYNIGKIKKESLPSATKIVAVVGSLPHSKLSADIISNPTENVKENGEKNSIRPTSPLADPQKYAKKLLRNNRSSAEASLIAKKLAEVAAAVNRSDYAEANRIATEAAREIMNSSRNLEIVSDDAMEIVESISKAAVTLSTKQKQEVAHFFGSYGEFRRRSVTFGCFSKKALTKAVNYIIIFLLQNLGTHYAAVAE